MKQSLYEITDKYKTALLYLEEEEEIDDSSLNLLRGLEGDIKEKAINVAAFLKNLEAQRNSIEDACEDMLKRKFRLEKNIGRLADYLKTNLEQSGIKEVTESPYFVIKIKTNPSSVVIDDAGKIAEEYKRTQVITTIDKAMIKNAIQEGKHIEGAHITQTTRLEIK